MPTTKRKPAPLTRDHADTLRALVTYLEAAFASFANGVGQLGVDVAGLAAPCAAVLAALGSFRRTSRLRDPVNVALGDAQAALVDVEASLTIVRGRLEASADPRSRDWCDGASYMLDAASHLDEALEATAEVVAHVRENPRSALLLADCVRAIAAVQNHAAHVRAHGRVQLATAAPAGPMN